MGYTHGIKWNDDLIASEIKRVIEMLGIYRFPTKSEIERCLGHRGLNKAISKYGGTRYWSEKMGYDVKDCESEFGYYFEQYALKDIKNNLGIEGYLNKPRYPYDITANHNIKINVKSSKLIKNKVGYQYYSFNLEKKEPTCDIYILYCVNNDKTINKTYIIPSCVFYNQNQVGISGNGISKYDKYLDRWDIIEFYNSFYKEVIEKFV